MSGTAHITGGGLQGNLQRVLPKDTDARIETGSWPVPPVFAFLQQQGRIEPDEMARVFNLGVGLVLIVRPTFADSIVRQLESLGERAFVIGRIVPVRGRVCVE